MADHVEKFDVLAPSGTPPINSVTTAVTFPPGEIVAIKVKIPGGHLRRTGLRIYYGASQVIPRTVGNWVRGNKVSFDFPFTDPKPGGGGWFTEVFNTGKYAHTFELYLEVNDLLTSVLSLPPILLLRQFGESLPAGSTPPTTVAPAPGSGGGVLRG